MKDSYYQRNKEVIKKKALLYYHKNKNKIKEKRLEYYRLHKPEFLERAKTNPRRLINKKKHYYKHTSALCFASKHRLFLY